MVAITTRYGKGSPLTNAEMDANLNNLNESQTVMGEPMGHADKTQSSISFNAGTRTFTIQPVSTSFVVWCKGEKYTYTTAQTVVIPDTAGLHYIYFSSSGVLSSKMAFFTWDEDAPTAYVYWNATDNEAIYFADERHGVTLDWQTHEYLHRTRGAAIANGFTLSGYTISGTGSSNADAQVTLEGGTFFDEDMQIDVVSTNTPTANTWQQDLSSPAQIPVLYLSGTEWKITTPNDYPVKKGTLLQYNVLSSGTWSVSDITSGDFTVSWILATNNLNYPVVAVLNQSATNTIGQAEELHFEDLTLPGFPSVEFRPLYRLIYQSANSYSNATKAKLVGVQDLRSVSAAGVTPSLISDHGNLSGLTDDDHPQYLSDTDVRPGIAQGVKDSLIPATPVAGGVAYGTATSLNFSVAGTAGQILTSGGASVPTWTTASSANTASAIVQRDASGNFTAGTITADLSGNATTATTATHLAGGGANRIAYQTGSGASAFAVAPTVTDTFLKWDGSAFAWASAGSNITDDTTTNATHYPIFSASNSGALSTVETSSTKLTYNPSTGLFTATGLSAATGSFSGLLSVGNLIRRTAAGQGWLDGGYNAVETSATTGAIYSIGGGSYFPTSSSLNTMYGVGYTYTGANQFSIGTVSGAANNTWGMYVCQNGSPGVFVGGDGNIWGAGALVMKGNITAYSDERVKTNWRDLPADFIEQLAKVKHGIYDRTDKDLTQIGVGAQSLRPVMEHAVSENDHGELSVAYGNAALVACIKLAERILELEAKLKERT